jgi:hypothetical protein
VNAQPLEALLPDPMVEIPEREAHRLRIESALRREQTVPPGGRLEELAGRFNLDALETDILAALWTAAFDPTLRDGKGFDVATAEMPAGRRLVAAGPFRNHDIVRAVVRRRWGPGNILRTHRVSAAGSLSDFAVTLAEPRDAEIPDIGCFRMSDPPLSVGVDGRRQFPRAATG